MIDLAHPDYGDTPASDARPSYRYQPRSAGQALVSIITPYFNAGAVFQDTIRSIQRMSVPYWEWLIVDDGSTDPASLAQLEGLEQRADGLDEAIQTRTAGAKQHGAVLQFWVGG